MKIVFIEPRSTEANVYSRISMPLLGPIYLGTILKARGHEVEIYNEDILRPDYGKLEADLIGISILTSTAKRGYEIADRFPREKVIMGGVHASLLPEEAIKHARQVVIGEAEEVIVDIAEGRITEPIVRGRPVGDLDSLPYPDFTLIKGDRSRTLAIPVSTSRGCPHDCSFCSVTRMFGRKYRFRSAENVMGELESNGRKSIFFCDDNFAAAPVRTYKLLDLLVKHDIKNWACQVRCDVTRDARMLGLMAKAGCQAVCVGLESVNEKTLKAYDKKQTVTQIIDAIRAFHKSKIKVHGMFVLGGDDDNMKTVWETVSFAVKQKIDTIQMMILTPFPGTRVYKDLESEKRIFTKDWNLYDGQHIVFRPKLLSAKELQLGVLKAYAKYYSLSKSFSLLIGLHFRNALLRFMGHSILKEWKHNNGKLSWLSSTPV
ncbi:MAG: radical SAM protein [Candidatus Omnitrophota bacterium]